MPNIERLNKYKKIHMIGIGGVSMSGIAEILNDWGFLVSGSNNVENTNTEKLKEAGIHVIIGHNEENVVGSDIVVYTAAVKDDNVELKAAKAQLEEMKGNLATISNQYSESNSELIAAINAIAAAGAEAMKNAQIALGNSGRAAQAGSISEQ